MTQNKKIKIIFFSLLTVVFLSSLGVYISAWPKMPKYLPKPSTLESREDSSLPLAKKTSSSFPSPQSPPTPEEKLDIAYAENLTEKVTVVAGEANIQISVAPNTTFYSALVEAKQRGILEFAGKNYPGLGFFVTDIGTLHTGDGKDLLYYVNGKEATVGVSKYVLKNGDVIEWKLE